MKLSSSSHVIDVVTMLIEANNRIKRYSSMTSSASGVASSAIFVSPTIRA